MTSVCVRRGGGGWCGGGLSKSITVLISSYEARKRLQVILTIMTIRAADNRLHWQAVGEVSVCKFGVEKGEGDA